MRAVPGRYPEDLRKVLHLKEPAKKCPTVLSNGASVTVIKKQAARDKHNGGKTLSLAFALPRRRAGGWSIALSRANRAAWFSVKWI